MEMRVNHQRHHQFYFALVIFTILFMQKTVYCRGFLKTTNLDELNLHVTRQNVADVFYIDKQQVTINKCSEETCIGLSSGTAQKIILNDVDKECTCQCHSHLPTFREDLRICVDNIHECSLASFIGGSTSQQIPFVFLPLKGQIIHPSKEIILNGIQSPLCVISGAKFLTESGWHELRNTIPQQISSQTVSPSTTTKITSTSSNVPFRLYHDEGRTFLQWMGEGDLRIKMSGKLILIQLMCRETEDSQNRKVTEENKIISEQFQQNQQQVQKESIFFSPCVAFRIVGTTSKQLFNNVSEVAFVPNNDDDSNSERGTLSRSDSLGVSEYVTIGICSVLLGLIYVASVFLYLHLRKKTLAETQSTLFSSSSVSSSSPSAANSLKKSHITGLLHKDVAVYNEDIGNNTKNIESKFPHLQSLSIEDGVPHKNTLLTGVHVFPVQLDSETSSSLDDSMEYLQKKTPDLVINQHKQLNTKKSTTKIQTTSAMVHHSKLFPVSDHQTSESSFSIQTSLVNEQNSNEKLPEENVSIIETLENTTESDQFNRVLIGAIVRRKLYFNPAYFDPQLLMAPPPAALEFLAKIREVITIAKQKMSLKKFTPNLMQIPEEDSITSSDLTKSKLKSKFKYKNSRRADDGFSKYHKLSELDGGLNEFSSINACNTCTNNNDSKHISIRKWLENVPSVHVNEPIKRRIRSPTRSLPPDGGYNNKNTKNVIDYNNRKDWELFGASSPRPASEPDTNNEYLKQKTRRKQILIVKPKTTPPPIPQQHQKQQHHYSVPNIVNMNSNIYETDSLERTSSIKKNNTNKKSNNTGTSIEFGEVSPTTTSQPSPSLSTALPLDEEMTIQNTVYNKNVIYDKKIINPTLQEPQYELIVLKRQKSYNLVSEVYVNDGYNYDTDSSSCDSTLEKKDIIQGGGIKKRQGSLLIRVEDCADNYIPVHDSDDFEPDTLDRKPASPPTPSLIHRNLEQNIDVDDKLSQQLSQKELSQPSILLKTSGSFRREITDNIIVDNERSQDENCAGNFSRVFGSLREIYEAKSRADGTAKLPPLMDYNDENYNDLTLEDRHSKRQRRFTICSNIIPPDVVPPLPIHERPKLFRKVLTDSLITMKPPLPPKNVLVSRSTSSNEKLSKGASAHSPILVFQQNKKNMNESVVIINKENDPDTRIIVRSTTSVPHLVSVMTSSVDTMKRLAEDSGYLSSTDSNDSKNNVYIRTNEVVGDPIGNNNSDESESSIDDNEEGNSESGAESVETHSVFFGSYRKISTTSKYSPNTLTDNATITLKPIVIE